MRNRLKQLKVQSWAKRVYNKLFGGEGVPSPVATKQSNANESSGEACVASMCILACVGVVFLGIGIGLYTGFNTNERARRRDEVSAAVEAWSTDDKLQKQIREANVFVELRTSGCDDTPSSLCPCLNTTTPLKATSKPPDVFRDSPARFKYDQLRLALNTSTLGWQLPTPSEADGYNCKLRVRYLQDGKEVADLETPLMRFEDTDITGDKCPRSLSRAGSARAEDSRACQEACSKLNGRYSDLSTSGIYYSCIVPYALNRVCVRAAPSGKDGALEEVLLNPALLPGEGCYPPPDFGKLQLQFGFTFSPVELLGTSSGGGAHGLAVELRSDEDPWLKYVAITKGTLEFRSKLNQKMSAGLALLILGAVLCLLWIPILYYGWRWLYSSERYNCPMGVGESLYDGTHKLAKRFGKDVLSDFQWPLPSKDLPVAAPKKVPEADKKLPASGQMSDASAASSAVPTASSGSNSSTASTSSAVATQGAAPTAGPAAFGVFIPNPLYRGSPRKGE